MKIYTLFLVVFLFSCGDKINLPDVTSSPESFGANDTSYVQLNPDWTASTMGYSVSNPMQPSDMTIGKDGYLFVADRANNRIITLTRAGQIPTYQNLDKIYPIENPVGIDIDSKLNLLIVNGTNGVYAWNQYLNNIGVTSIITGVDSTSGKYIYSSNAALLDSITGIYPIYVDTDPNARFQGITFGPSKDNTVFVTDNGTNRIIELRLEISTAVKLTNGRLYPVFTCVYKNTIAEYGTGAGTVDDPRGITCDASGNIYFTQLGSNFLVQKLNANNNTYTSAFTLYENPIMDLNRFKGPFDVALGSDNSIFVIDAADSGRVTKFYNKGSLAGSQVDLGKIGLTYARFNNPMSIVISNDEVVYIANTDDNKIERYQYTVSSNDIPQTPQ